MSRIKHILKLHPQGTSKLQISTLTGVSRNTIRRYLATQESLDFGWSELQRKSDHELDMLFCQEPAQAPEARLVTLHAYLHVHDKRLRQRGITLDRQFQHYHRERPEGYGRTAFYRH